MKTEKQKVAAVRKTFKQVLDVAIKHGMIKNADAFKAQLDLNIRPAEGCSANSREVNLSTHDRYCDPEAYRQEVASRIGGKRNWARLRKFAREGYFVWVEYRRIDKDAEIGSIITKSDRASLIFIMATAAHELAHAINMWNDRQNRVPMAQRDPGHGVEWQAIYRKLRRLTVNPILEALKEDVPCAAKKFAAVRPPQSEGVVARVWEICNYMHSENKGRKDIIMECVLEGISPGTAATQYARWNRARHQ